MNRDDVIKIGLMINTYPLWFSLPEAHRWGRGSLFWRGWCTGRSPRAGPPLLPRKPIGWLGGHWRQIWWTYYWRSHLHGRSIGGWVSLNDTWYTFSLEGGSLDEVLSWFLISLDLPEGHGSWSETVLPDSGTDWGSLSCDLLGVEVLLGCDLWAFLRDGFRAGHFTNKIY